MKKSTLVILICAAMVCFRDSPSFAVPYTFQQITYNNEDDYGPRINASGHVVWYGYDGTDWEIFLYDPSTGIIQITDNFDTDFHPVINDSGQVVWTRVYLLPNPYETNAEIFLYDSGTATTTRITDNSYDDREPQINGSGKVVWQGSFPAAGIYLYDSVTEETTVVSSGVFGEHISPRINASGQVAWTNWNEKYPTFSDIWLHTPFASPSVEKISPVDGPCDYCDVLDLSPRIDGSGRVAWRRGSGANLEIFLYDPAAVPQVKMISNSSISFENDPRINARGQVVWYGYDGYESTDSEIFLYDTGTGITTRITDNDSDDHSPRINDSGKVVWVRCADPGSYVFPEILLYDILTGTTTTVLGSLGPGGQCAEFDSHEINAAGQVVFSGGIDSEIFIASPASGTTRVGTGVVAVPTDITTGETPVTVTFDQVTAGGETTLETITGSPPPTGFKLGTPPTYYDIETTASFTGNVRICIDYSGVSYGNENNLRLIHEGAGGPVDITDPGYPDTVNDIICGTVDHLSRFAILEPAIVCPSEPVSVQAGTITCAYSLSYAPAAGATTEWDWGDGYTSAGVIGTDPPQITGSHAYLDPGVYTVRLDGTEDSTPWSDSYRYVVVYDPYGGFVTGGGWIPSPAGAYALSPTLSGKATFGFVAKYKKGADVPVGNTEFQFHAADFTFRSTEYDWLVVAGARAKFKGTGAIDGTGNYGFLLTAVDGALPGGGGADKFRIKIWDRSTGAVVYDNWMGETDDSDSATAIGGGSIVFHK